MIINSKTGCLVTGILTKDPEYKEVGAKSTPLLKLDLIYGHDAPEHEGQEGAPKYMSVDLWGLAARTLSGKLWKGDAVAAAGALESREYNGKTYWRINCRGEIWPSGAALLGYLMTLDIGSTAQAMDGNTLDPSKLETGGGFEIVDGNEDLPF